MSTDRWCVRVPGHREEWAYLLTPDGARAVNAAAVFECREDAEALIAAVKANIAYKAPETLSPGFAKRLEQAEVVEVPDGVKPWSAATIRRMGLT